MIHTTQKQTNIGFGNTKKNAPFNLCSLCLVCLFLLVVVFVLIRNIHLQQSCISSHLLACGQTSISFVCYIRGTQRRFPPKNIESSFQAIQCTFRPLALHSKRWYKTCICSVILGKFESFRNCRGFSIVFSKSFRCIPYLFD